jgi:hypothetical protein
MRISKCLLDLSDIFSYVLSYGRQRLVFGFDIVYNDYFIIFYLRGTSLCMMAQYFILSL